MTVSFVSLILIRSLPCVNANCLETKQSSGTRILKDLMMRGMI